MPCTSPDFHQKSFRIKHDDDKFFTRLASKELSSKSSNSASFRVLYYGDVSSAVPFMWETRPGTPKHAFHDNSNIPPLAPPPSSYHTNIINLNNSSNNNSRSKLQLLHTLLRRSMNPKNKSHLASSPSSSLASLSSSCSSFRDPMMSTPTSTYAAHRRRRFSSWGGHEIRPIMDDHHRDEVWPSRLCFGIGKDNGERVHQGGYSSVLIMKKAFLSIVGHRSA